MKFDARAAARRLAPDLKLADPDIEAIAAGLDAAYREGLAARPSAIAPTLEDTRRPPSPRQAMMLDFIVEFMATHSYGPSFREIMAHMEINSTNAVRDHLEALIKKGYLKRQPFNSRSIELVNWPPVNVLAQLRKLGDPLYPVEQALRVCAQAADHLVHALDWDGHGWDTVRGGVRVAAAYLNNRMPTEADLGCGPATPALEELRNRPSFGPEYGQ